MIDDLLSFKAVVDEGSITSATKKLHITQPALTKKLQKLEKKLNTELLIRTNKGVELTAEGELVYDHASKIAQSWSNLNRKMEYNQNKSLTIKFGMIDNIALSLHDNFYKKLSEKLDRIDLHVKIHNSTRLVDSVRSGHLDLAIITRPNKLHDELSYSFFHKESFKIVANPSIAKKIQTKNDLEKISFASYNEESNTHKHISTILKDNDLKIKYKIFSTSPEFLIKMVINNNYVAVLPENLTKEYIKDNSLSLIEFNEMTFDRELVLIHNKDTFLTSELGYFIDEIKESI